MPQGESPCACCAIAIPLITVLLLFGYLTLFGTPTFAADIIFHVCVENGTLHTMDMDYSNYTLTYSLSAVFSFRNIWYQDFLKKKGDDLQACGRALLWRPAAGSGIQSADLPGAACGDDDGSHRRAGAAGWWRSGRQNARG